MEFHVQVYNSVDFLKCSVREICCHVGQVVKSYIDDLIEIDTEKTTFAIYAERDGIVKSIAVKIGQELTCGDLILTLEVEDKVEKLSFVDKPIDNRVCWTSVNDYTSWGMGGYTIAEYFVKVGEFVVKSQLIAVIVFDPCEEPQYSMGKQFIYAPYAGEVFYINESSYGLLIDPSVYKSPSQRD